ncbi:MAG TPA: WXG100 family type VII secretion target [Acidimicrobiales bacterium]|nr:WXG100 family type VII secretion target [Acidimicrobiales bacterium]
MVSQIRVTPEELQGCSVTFRNESAAVNELIIRLDGQLNGIDWAGQSALRFRSMWEGEFKKVLRRMADELSLSADHLSERAASALAYDGA